MNPETTAAPAANPTLPDGRVLATSLETAQAGEWVEFSPADPYRPSRMVQIERTTKAIIAFSGYEFGRHGYVRGRSSGSYYHARIACVTPEQLQKTEQRAWRHDAIAHLKQLAHAWEKLTDDQLGAMLAADELLAACRLMLEAECRNGYGAALRERDPDTLDEHAAVYLNALDAIGKSLAKAEGRKP